MPKKMSGNAKRVGLEAEGVTISAAANFPPKVVRLPPSIRSTK